MGSQMETPITTIPSMQADQISYQGLEPTEVSVSPVATSASLHAPFEKVRDMLSEKPLKRPNRTRPITE